MKQVCIYCNRSSPDSNIWCQEIYCPAEQSPTILNFGEQIGDLEIVKPLMVLRSCAVYEAKRGKTAVLLKIAHDGYHKRLEREARFLLELRQAQNLAQTYPMLPVILPAHEQEDIRKHYYGKTVFRGEPRYYSVFRFIEGEPLRALLLKNPQLWYQQVGSLLISISHAIAIMHQRNVFHLCLTPDAILVRFDKQNIPRPVLLDLGTASDKREIDKLWNSWYVPFAYQPPEVIQNGRIISAPTTDVYGLGVILYELLAGQPAYTFKQHTDADIKHTVLHEQPVPINRFDLIGVPEIANQATHKDYRQRYPEVTILLSQLLNYFSAIPEEKQSRRINWQTVTIVAGVLVALHLLVWLALLTS